MFTEANTVEQRVPDACLTLSWGLAPLWKFPRPPLDVFFELLLGGLLSHLNFEFASHSVRRTQRGVLE